MKLNTIVVGGDWKHVEKEINRVTRTTPEERRRQLDSLIARKYTRCPV